MNNSEVRYFCADRLAVEVHPDRSALGGAAARAAAAGIHEAIVDRGEARVIFACAPSQDEFLQSLLDPSICDTPIDWRKVSVFHMDDYIGLTGSHPQSFRHYLHSHLLRHIEVKAFHPIVAEDPDIEAACLKYAALLSERPIDLICLGIGENGHIAFNDPPVADFDDRKLIKKVALDDACRHQQVHDGCFPSFADVPAHALTLTIPVFRRARRLSVHVPGPRKAGAIRDTITAPITPACPATILRTHPHATLFVDRESASLL